MARGVPGGAAGRAGRAVPEATARRDAAPSRHPACPRRRRVARPGCPSGLSEAGAGRSGTGRLGLADLQYLLRLPAEPSGGRVRSSTLTRVGRSVAGPCGHGGRRSRPRTALRSDGAKAAAGRGDDRAACDHPAGLPARPPRRARRPEARVRHARGAAGCFVPPTFLSELFPTRVRSSCSPC